MEAWLLREWQRTGFWQILLRPLSWAYASLAATRRGLYRAGILKSQCIGIPVIVVGNITVGGTGKTPVVLAIAQHLARSGWRCGIISRGYTRLRAGNRLRGESATAPVIRVVPESADPAVTGDEALLLARRSDVPVYVSADRAAAARSLLHDHPEVEVLICDDGLQHYALRRDLGICVIDGARGFGNGAMLPAGPLREPITRLAQVDVIVINGTAAAGQWNPGNALSDVPCYAMTLGNESLVRVRDGKVISIEQGLAEFSTKYLQAIAGTGNPARFFAHLASLGFKCADCRAFPDHHSYTASGLAEPDVGVILMTEKDAVKCRAFADDRMWFMRVDAILPDGFGEFVVKRLSDLKK
jgi:tetraacyldisaccharide 4'-kinase